MKNVWKHETNNQGCKTAGRAAGRPKAGRAAAEIFKNGPAFGWPAAGRSEKNRPVNINKL
jgi:hypothetical protein